MYAQIYFDGRALPLCAACFTCLPASRVVCLPACLPALPALPACHGGYEFSCSTVVHVYSHRRPPVFSSTLRSCSGAHFAMPVRTARAAPTSSSEATVVRFHSHVGFLNFPRRHGDAENAFACMKSPIRGKRKGDAVRAHARVLINGGKTTFNASRHLRCVADRSADPSSVSSPPPLTPRATSYGVLSA